MLDAYEKTPIFIPVDIPEDVVKLVAWKLSGVWALEVRTWTFIQGRILKSGGGIKILRTTVEIFIHWIANRSPPWAAYCTFMSGRLIVLEKQPGIHPVGIGKNWKRLFDKFLLSVIGPESTSACQDDHTCAGLKAVIIVQPTGLKIFWTLSQQQKIVYFYSYI